MPTALWPPDLREEEEENAWFPGSQSEAATAAVGSCRGAAVYEGDVCLGQPSESPEHRPLRSHQRLTQAMRGLDVCHEAILVGWLWG